MRKKCKILLLLVAFIMLTSGCGVYHEVNLWPDDDFSRAVREALGKDFYYHGSEERDLYGTCYEYQIKKEDADTIEKFAETVSVLMSGKQNKISIYVFSRFSYGGTENVFCLLNYSDKNLKTADITDGLYLYICNPICVENPIYFEPSTYAGIKGVKILSISSQMSQTAEAEGIDWYAYWPDLQEIIIREE